MNPIEARALLARLLRRIAPEVDLATIDPAAPLQEAADLDSMDFLNLVAAVYEDTGIDIPERDYPSIASVDGFVARLAADQSPSSSGPRSAEA